MKRFLLASLPLLLLAACGGPAANPDPNHTHADFAMWINGRKVNFALEKYMSGSATDDASHDEEGEYHHKYFHLHDGLGHVLHQHKPGLPLSEFFTSLGFTFSPGCVRPDGGEQVCNRGDQRWRMFVNGVEQSFDLSYVFADTDKILLTYGADDAALADQLSKMTDDACLYSRTCPERGEPPAENCIANPAVPCVAPDE